MASNAKRNTAAKRNCEPTLRRLACPDGRLVFELSRTARGVYVKRVEVLSPSSSMSHGMLCISTGDFARNLETDIVRFKQPVFYSQVEREVEGMLDDNR